MTRTRPFRRILLLPLALAALMLTGCVPPWPGIGQTSVTSIPRTGGQYAGPSSNVTTGPDGALYLVQRDGMVRRDPGSPGSVAHIPLAGRCQQVGRLVLGPDGALWGTAIGCPTGDLLRITTSGVVRTYALTTRRIAAPSALTVGPDRNLWAAIGTTLYRLTPGGAVTAFPNVGGKITSLATGPDHSLWFTLSNGVKGPNLGRLTGFGFQLFPTPTGPLSPTTLIAGPDGAMWFGTLLGAYGKITTTGTLTTYGLVNGAALAFTDAVATPDAVWFAAMNGAAVRIVPNVGATAYQLSPDQHSQPALINGITAARDGSVWLSSSVLDTQLYRVATGGSLQSTVAVRGLNSGLYVQHNMDGHWIGLGGGLRSRPSVFALNGVDYYVAEGNDGHPYVRTDSLNWQRMSSSVLCPSPVARVWNNLLILACGGSALYSTVLPGPGALPSLAGSKANLGRPAGAVGSPALLDGSGTHLAWATSNRGAPGPTYTNLFGRWTPTALQCASSPTAQRSQSTIYLACVNAAHQLQYVTSLAGISPWSGAHTVLGTSGVGTPGLIAIPDGTVSAVLVGQGGSVSESRLTPLIGSLHSSLGGVALPDLSAAGP